MLHRVDVGTQSIAAYAPSAGAEVVEELHALAAPLRGARVLHLNATPYGGGVAEILRSEAPLLRDLGLAAEWQLITGDDAFFSVTKAIHNGLQGASRDLSPVERETKPLEGVDLDISDAGEISETCMLESSSE
jgi:trehalose synthase